MIDYYELLPDEYVIFACEEVGLILTNINIVEMKSKGLLNPTYTSIRHPINKIKISNRKAQIRLEENWIHIQFTNERKSFELYCDKDAKKWINEINKLATGVNTDFIPKDKGEIFNEAVTESKDTGRAIGEAVLGSIPLPGTKFIGRTFGGIVGGVVGGTISGVASIIQPQQTHKPRKAMSIDEQIDAVKKLKDLVDAGILSEDEFNKKKKEIMGL